MRTLLNVVWLLFSGLWMALGYAVAGLVCLVLIVTIPWGIACFRIAAYALWPFGQRVVERPGAGVASGVGNVVWLVFAGIWLTLGHLAAGIGFFLTVIGIPFGIAHFKMIPVSLMPLGREIVPSDTAYPSYRWSASR
ncbi:YccF domain-containing protein [Streptomyces sp. TRM 70361]|uniref:YccF domain-containing protein n=1 Tax=Streptomyces sp. TRM 70361 TaxID=3116553 RepID=UPI002E7B3A74|nr:YccF domain-containing protein [Streptomyces sp. TRM 70361]MEE1940482.1 YccF domain-containing protein [Streptomyces sp. TRM 70361]